VYVRKIVNFYKNHRRANTSNQGAQKMSWPAWASATTACSHVIDRLSLTSPSPTRDFNIVGPGIDPPGLLFRSTMVVLGCAFAYFLRYVFAGL
jgi:hypothetical protein